MMVVTRGAPAAPAPWLLYGATGYTGRLIARMAVERGLPPVLAGRNERKLRVLAADLGVEYRVFRLDDAAALEAALADVALVLHCAGPFVHTFRPMVDACLRTRTHYLDITGEIVVFESLAARHAAARGAGILVLPGVGFDVVPSDCLAAHLQRRLPSATRLTLAFQGRGTRPSRGTMLSALEHAHRGGVVRRDGVLTRAALSGKTRAIDFGNGPVTAMAIPWGDVSTAYHSTGIPNIEVYAVLPAGPRRLMAVGRYAGWMLRAPAVRALLRWVVQRQPAGPSDVQRARGVSLLWGEAEDAAGRRVVSRLRGPEGYTFTALTALALVQRVLAGQPPAGFQTPSRAYGADFVLEIPGVTREDAR